MAQMAAIPVLKLTRKLATPNPFPFEKGGKRGIFFGLPWRNPRKSSFAKGGILFKDRPLILPWRISIESNSPALD
jgi:hypothetical protein